MAEKQIERIRLNEVINKLELKFLEKIGDRKLICYGASALWPDINRIIAIDDLVEFFVDKDRSKQGEEYFGKEIKSPIEISNVDKREYAVVVLAGAFDEISMVLNRMGWKKDIDYYNINQYINIYKEVSFGCINQYLRFLDTVPTEIRNMSVREESERIGIVLNAEGLNFGTTYIPYLVSLFLILKWRGYNVKLIVDRLHWEGDIELYEGHCDLCDYIRDIVINKLEKFVPKEDILYIDAVGDTELSIEDEMECERIARYTVGWSKWYNYWNSRFRSKEVLLDDFAQIYKRNLSYINVFFDKYHFDTINAISALHKMAGVYYYAGKKRNMRVSSQDGQLGSTLICANGPSSYGQDIPDFLEKMWEEITDKKEILDRAVRMWKKRRGASAKVSDMSFDEYLNKRKEEGYENISFQTPQTTLEQIYDVVIPLNIMDDGAALGTFTIFGDRKQWLEKTLAYVIHELNGTILIREHPAWNLQPPYMVSSELYLIYPEILAPYEGNRSLRYVRAEEEINLYQYIEQCKVVIPWTSTVGIEAALMGKNVLVHTDANYRNAVFASQVHTQDEYFENLKKCIMDEKFLVEDKQQAYEDALKYFYYTMNRRLTTDFTIVNANWGDWKFNSFEELLTAEGVDEVVQIVADNVPSVYLIEKQRRRLGQL